MRWIIGDIHGMLRPLNALLEGIDRVDPAPRLYFVGDYVNRGPEPRGVIERLLSLKNARFLRGNHDDTFLEILGGESCGTEPEKRDPIAAFQWFMQYGLDRTLVSYGADLAELQWLVQWPSAQRLESILACVPATHRRFIEQLELVIEDEDLFVGHGRWDPAWPDSPSIADQMNRDGDKRQTMLWGRFEPRDLSSAVSWRRVGYFGHTPVPNYDSMGRQDPYEPLATDRLVLVDTAAALGVEGRLTAYCHELGAHLQAMREGRLMTPEPVPARRG